MMEYKFLLTYLKGGKTDFNWFENQEEMQFFIDNNKLDGIFGAIKITDFEEVGINFKADK